MVIFELKYPERPSINFITISWFRFLLQQMVNRIYIGYIRYGDKKSDFREFIKSEFKTYEETGNGEHLINLANYALLEWIYPSNPAFHCDDTVESIRRK